MKKRLLTACLLAGLALSFPSHADREAQAARYYEDALTRYERGDDAGAIIQLKNALKEDGRMLPALVLLGQAHLRRGEPAAAERVLADAERLGASRSEISIYQAQAYFDQGKYRALLERFGAAGLPAQHRLEMLLMRSRAQLALGQLEAAMDGAREAEQIAGGETRALALQAQIHLNAGRAADAHAAVQRALQRAPRDTAAWTLQASIAHARGDLVAAARDYSRALEFQPDNLEARLARAGIWLDLEREADAKADIEYLHAKFPNDPRGAYLRALYHARRGEADAARTAMRDVADTLAQLSPDFLAASDQLQLLGGLAHHALGEFERAKTYLSAYQDKHPREAGARKLLGSIYLAERQYDGAIAQLQPVVRSHPGDAQALSLMGSAYMAKGNHAQAARLFQEAAQAGDSAEVQTGLGLSLLGIGQREAGFAALLRAYEQAPATAQAGVPLALAYLKRGDAKRAVAIIDPLVQREPANASLRNLQGVPSLPPATAPAPVPPMSLRSRLRAASIRRTSTSRGSTRRKGRSSVHVSVTSASSRSSPITPTRCWSSPAWKRAWVVRKKPCAGSTRPRVSTARTYVRGWPATDCTCALARRSRRSMRPARRRPSRRTIPRR